MNDILVKSLRLGPNRGDLEPDDWLPEILEKKSKWGDLVFDPGSCYFIPNQNMEVSINQSGLLLLEAMQDHSTPGVIIRQDVALEPGEYDIEVIGEASVARTFFPWVRDTKTGLRLTPTVHLGTDLDSVSAPFTVEERSILEIGVLCHHQNKGDKCAISRFSILKRVPPRIESKGSYNSIEFHSFVAHKNTILDHRDSYLKIKSEPGSTPGTYARIDVRPCTKLSIRARIRMATNCTGFLYIADDLTGKELTRRTVVFDDYSERDDGIQEKYTYLDIPEEVKSIKIGILFSTVSTADIYQLEIHSMEVVEIVEFNKLVDRAYVLSLEDEKEKFDVCQREAGRHNISLNRWIATNGYSDQNMNDWQDYMRKPWTELDHKLNRKAINKPGAWGYLLSMEEIFQKSINEGLDCIAVFDDDFILCNTFTHDFSRLMEQVGDNWDILYLGASQWAWDNVVISEDKGYYIPTKNTNGTFAVVYKKPVFEDILEEIRKMDCPFDSGPLANLTTGKYSNRSYVSFPNIAIANVEKDGIRESRNQIQYARRFRWNLEKFPPYFTNWSIGPKIEREDWNCGFGPQDVDYFVGVTTYNRIDYLENFIKTFEETLNDEYNWCLIIADDGSTDGTLEWLLTELEPIGYGLIVIQNDSLGIARQSNSILSMMMEMRVARKRILFMCDDDIRFNRKGWEDLYSSAMDEHGLDHLVYFNPNWKTPNFEEYKHGYSPLIANCNARDVMGCFYTVTEELIDKIGFFDEKEFPVRGHSHVDFTIRACRAGENFLESTFDALGSNDYIAMEEKDGYRRTHKILGLWEHEQLHGFNNRTRREMVLNDEDRIYVSGR